MVRLTEKLKERLSLVAAVTAVTVPFMFGRTIRTAGDEKVYLNQALEMEQCGNWFLQRLHDVPNYHKGPLHYILLRIGFMLFGKHSLWPTLYMNWIYLLIGSLSVCAIVQRRFPQWKNGGFFVGLWFSLSLGVYAHSFASQMEAGLAGLFALGLYFLDSKKDFKFWCVAGIVGWLKSPVHSVFLGSAAVVYWFFTKELIIRLNSLKAWASVVVGILVCASLYAPAYFFDRENFVNTYLIRETLSKGPSGQSWIVPIVSTYGFYLFPALFIALVAYADGLFRILKGISNKLLSFRKWEVSERERLLWLGISLPLPSTLFFMQHPYRFENYNLPGISGVILFLSGFIATRKPFLDRYYRGAMGITGFMILLFSGLLITVVLQFKHLPVWLSPVVTLFSFIFLCVGAVGMIVIAIKKLKQLPFKAFILNAGICYFGFSLLLMQLGERELWDIRTYLKEHPAVRLSYYNLNDNIWSEWGYLNLMIPYPVWGLQNQSQLDEAISRNDTILVPGDPYLGEMKDKLKNQNLSYVVIPWRRWRTRGLDEQGNPLWIKAFREGNWDLLTRDFYIVEVKRKST